MLCPIFVCFVHGFVEIYYFIPGDFMLYYNGIYLYNTTKEMETKL